MSRAEFDRDVKRPGKFQGCQPWAPYFYEFMGEGEFLAGQDDFGEYMEGFEVTDDDTAIFPELASFNFVVLRESDQGFVSTDEMDKVRYTRFKHRVEQMHEANGDDKE